MTTSDRDLSRFAGIIYPDVFQVDDLVLPMLDTMRTGLKPVKDVHMYKNIKIGSVGAKIGFNEKKTIFATLDGHVENISALQKEVVKNGFTGSTDDPVRILIAAYEIWNEKCVEKIDGNFAFAIYDTLEEQLLLARDRIGNKPLYWYHDSRHFIFASELKALLATGFVPQTPAIDAIAMYLYFGFIPQDLSPVQGVSKLLPSNYLIYHPNKGCSIKPYWSYSSFFMEQREHRPKQITEKIAELLENATQKIIPASSKDLGCFVMGGLGSATSAWEVSHMAKNSQVVQAYTATFGEESDGDLQVIREIADTLKIPLNEGRITPENLTDSLINIIWNLDEPLADPNFIATWKMSELASKNCSYVYSGMGSDEFLAGHSRYTTVEQDAGLLNRLKLIPSPILQNIIIPLIHSFSPKAAYHLLKVSRTNPWQFAYLHHNAIFDETLLKSAAPRLAKVFDPDTFLHKFHQMPRIASSVSQLLYFDVKTRLPDLFMLQYERITKAHGLHWGSPFLNRELIEFLAGLKEPEFLPESMAASYLKPIIYPLYSSQIIERPKRSRPTFLTAWLELPEIHTLFQQLLKGTLIESGIISEPWLREQLYGYKKEKSSFRKLWSLLVLEIWFHLFINRPVRSRPSTLDIKTLLSEI